MNEDLMVPGWARGGVRRVSNNRWRLIATDDRTSIGVVDFVQGAYVATSANSTPDAPMESEPLASLTDALEWLNRNW